VQPVQAGGASSKRAHAHRGPIFSASPDIGPA